MPVVPTVLVNGADGIGTGWSTSIPNFNPRDIVSGGRNEMEVWSCRVFHVLLVFHLPVHG